MKDRKLAFSYSARQIALRTSRDDFLASFGKSGKVAEQEILEQPHVLIGKSHL